MKPYHASDPLAPLLSKAVGLSCKQVENRLSESHSVVGSTEEAGKHIMVTYQQSPAESQTVTFRRNALLPLVLCSDDQSALVMCVCYK